VFRDRVVLAVSELVANVVQHTAGGGTMRAWTPTAHVPLRVEVADEDQTLPQQRTPSDTGGRGLMIIGEISDDWGAVTTSHGKIVWAEFLQAHVDHSVCGVCTRVLRKDDATGIARIWRVGAPSVTVWGPNVIHSECRDNLGIAAGVELRGRSLYTIDWTAVWLRQTAAFN
jgi:hypothetical protein